MALRAIMAQIGNLWLTLESPELAHKSATSSMWLLSTWNMVGANRDVLYE